MMEKSDIRIVRSDGIKLFHISNGPIAGEILRDTETFSKRDLFFYAAIRESGPDNIVSADSGPFWQLLHSHLVKKFTPAAMKNFAALVVKNIDVATRQFISSGETFDVEKEMRYVTGKIIGRYLFSEDIQDNELRSLIDAVTELPVEFSLPKIGNQSPFASLIRSDLSQQTIFTPRQKVLFNIINNVFTEIFARRNSRSNKPDDLLTLLSQITTDRPTLVRDNVLTFFIAGQETISVSLTMAIKEILAHPEVMEKIRCEVDETLNVKTGLTEYFNRLTFTKNVLMEVMRLHPSAPILHRSVMQNKIISGVFEPFQKGDLVILDISRIHRNPRHWPNPDDFKPERFERPPFKDSFMPFSTGERICLGGPMAMTEGVICLAQLFSQAQIILKADTITSQRSVVVTARPVGTLHVSLAEREHRPRCLFE